MKQHASIGEVEEHTGGNLARCRQVKFEPICMCVVCSNLTSGTVHSGLVVGASRADRHVPFGFLARQRGLFFLVLARVGSLSTPFPISPFVFIFSPALSLSQSCVLGLPCVPRIHTVQCSFSFCSSICYHLMAVCIA